MAWLHDVVFDCRHPASLARFWAGVLDGYEVAPYDEAELERLRSKGIFDTEDDPMVLVERPGGRDRVTSSNSYRRASLANQEPIAAL